MPLSACAAARWREQTLGLDYDTFHNFACRWDVVDQRTGFADNDGGNIKIATLARRCCHAAANGFLLNLCGTSKEPRGQSG
jgi:hypothetical protein